MKKYLIGLLALACWMAGCSDSAVNGPDSEQINPSGECTWTDAEGNEKTASCSDAQACCPGSGCVGLADDALNCGKCGNVCKSGEICRDSSCVKDDNNTISTDTPNNGEDGGDKPVGCASGLTLCGGECFDLKNDKKHCGSCDQTCPEDRDCYNAACICADARQSLCDDECVDLAATNRSGCQFCSPGFGNCDGDWSNGCEVKLADSRRTACEACEEGFGNCDGDWSNGCELKLAETQRVQCEECVAGYGNCDDDWSNGCEKQVSEDDANCGACRKSCSEDEKCANGNCIISCAGDKYQCNVNGQPACVDISNTVEHCGGCDYNCNELPNVASAKCENGECVITACQSGLVECDRNPSNGCETKPESDANYCGAVGLCDDSLGKGHSAGKKCVTGEACENAKCVPVLSEIGCSDGTREGFIDVATYPLIAACGGAWTIKGIHHNEPACKRASGNTGTNRDGKDCNVEDLCAEGWHVCLGRDDVKSRTTLGCSGIMDGLPKEPAFFITRTSSTGNLNCAPDTAGTDNNMNDIFGCGNLGCSASGATCTPLELSAHNLCGAMKNYSCGCKKNGDGTVTCNTSCSGYTFNTPSAHPLQYFAVLNDKSYPVAWTCDGDSTGWHEARDVLKAYPDQQGGALCCKDQCKTDDDCGGTQVCSFHVCVDKAF